VCVVERISVSLLYRFCCGFALGLNFNKKKKSGGGRRDSSLLFVMKLFFVVDFFVCLLVQPRLPSVNPRARQR